MHHVMSGQLRPYLRSLTVATLMMLVGDAPAAQAVPKPARPAKPTAKPTPKPTPAASTPITASSLGATLKALGYKPEAAGPVQVLKVEEADRSYGYPLQVAVSKSGDWLVAAAHLAPVPDLTAVPASALLALLTHNDELVGMAFGYQREEGRVVLNATLPLRGLDPASIRNLIEAMKATVRATEGLWDPARW